MKGSREDDSSRPARTRKGHAPTNTAAPPSLGEEGKDTLIQAQCPDCGKAYKLPASTVGKDGRCSCGTVFPIRSTRAASEDIASPSAGQHHQASAPPGDETGEVRVGCIGRGHAGKTALLRTLGEGPVGDFFPSGLHVDAGDPREVAQMIREAEQAQRLLHTFGLPPTLQESQIRYCLYDGAAPRVAYRFREVIGQVLSHTLPDSAAELQASFTQYLKGLVTTHVLWAVVPCSPPNPSARDHRRYANDLRITLAYLREALRLRLPEQSVAVALVLSKVDVLFQDAEQARAALTDEVLRDCLGPLVHLVEQSALVSDAAIIPVSAFGFGNAILREDGSEASGRPVESEEEPFGAEPIWLLREGVSAQPANLDTLFLWTLLAGLIQRTGHGAIKESTDQGEICQTLAADLNAIGPWLLPLKGDIAREGREGFQMQRGR